MNIKKPRQLPHVYKLNNWTGEFQLAFENKVDEKLIHGVIGLINLFSHDLDDSNLNSSVYKLNNSQCGIPVSVNPELLSYLDTLKNIFTYLKGINSEIALEEYELFIGENFRVTKGKLIKLEDFQIKTRLFLREFILENIKKFLKENAKQTFTISTKSFFLTMGQIADLKFAGLDKDFNYFNKNFSALNFPIRQRNEVSKFGIKEELSEYSEVIFIGENLITLKVLREYSSTYKYPYQFKELALQFKIKILLLNEDFEVIESFV